MEDIGLLRGPIAAGEEVTVSYSAAALFRPREQRQAILRERWGFACDCPRCRGELTPEAGAAWALLEKAAAAADAAKPRRREVDAWIAPLQRRAARALAAALPLLPEGARFAADARYFAS